MTGNDWNRSELLVMKTLERIEGGLKANSEDIADLKAKAAVWGFAAGLIPVLLGLAYEHLR